ncbi:hypothetical protein KSS87_023458 [Heliosperma pusillum]|nr:hypothetical protein KSS87_023458 [Heliosperma pusillum]
MSIGIGIGIDSNQSSMATTAAAAAAAATSSSTLFPSVTFQHTRLSISILPRRPPSPFSLKVSASVSSPLSPIIQTTPDDLVTSILSKVIQTDRGVQLTRDEHKAVGELATQLQIFCVDAPVNSPLIFGEWDVVYCSNPTSPGGGYRSAIGRLIFNTKEMIQAVEAPDIVRNKVSLSAFGFLDGEVSLKGKPNSKHLILFLISSF